MPIAPVPDPLPDNPSYTITMAVNDPNLGWVNVGQFAPGFSSPPVEPADLDDFVQGLVDYMSAFPNAEVTAYKNRGFSQEITPTEE